MYNTFGKPMGVAARRMTAPQQVLVYGSSIIFLAVVLGAVWLWLRRRLREPIEPVREGFSIESLEQLRRQGMISQEEFDRLRRQVMGLAEPSGPSALRPEGSNDDERTGDAEGK